MGSHDQKSPIRKSNAHIPNQINSSAQRNDSFSQGYPPYNQPYNMATPVYNEEIMDYNAYGDPMQGYGYAPHTYPVSPYGNFPPPPNPMMPPMGYPPMAPPYQQPYGYPYDPNMQQYPPLSEQENRVWVFSLMHIMFRRLQMFKRDKIIRCERIANKI